MAARPQKKKERDGLSLLEIAQYRSADPRKARLAANKVFDQTLDHMAQTSSLKLFKLAMCMVDPSDGIDVLRDGLACVSAYSCMSFWGMELLLRIASGTWCYSKWMTTLDYTSQVSLRAPYREFVHEVIAPTWDAFMFANIPSKSIVTGDLLTGMEPDATANYDELHKWAPDDMELTSAPLTIDYLRSYGIGA